MIAILSWILILCIAFYSLGILVVGFISPVSIPFIVGLFAIIGVTASLALLVILIKERIKDKEAEKDDLDKY